MLNNTSGHINYLLNKLSSDDPITLTEVSYNLNNQDLNYDNIIGLLNSNSSNVICFGLVKLNRIRKKEDAKKLINCLTHSDSRVRELSSSLIKNHLLSQEYKNWFQDNKYHQIFANSIMDSNPKVCRNIIHSFKNINNNLLVVKKIIEILKDNPSIYSIYWGLYGINTVLKHNYSIQIIPEVIEILIKTCNSTEYPIRERSAFILNTINQFQIKNSEIDKILTQLTHKLSNDNNFYVRNAISGLQEV